MVTLAVLAVPVLKEKWERWACLEGRQKEQKVYQEKTGVMEEMGSLEEVVTLATQELQENKERLERLEKTGKQEKQEVMEDQVTLADQVTQEDKEKPWWELLEIQAGLEKLEFLEVMELLAPRVCLAHQDDLEAGEQEESPEFPEMELLEKTEYPAHQEERGLKVNVEKMVETAVQGGTAGPDTLEQQVCPEREEVKVKWEIWDIAATLDIQEAQETRVREELQELQELQEKQGIQEVRDLLDVMVIPGDPGVGETGALPVHPGKITTLLDLLVPQDERVLPANLAGAVILDHQVCQVVQEDPVRSPDPPDIPDVPEQRGFVEIRDRLEL